jgi:hypothetical protein
MGSAITVQARMVGRKEPLFADWSIPYPPDLRDEGDRITLRHLITRVVLAEVNAFRQRQSEQRFLKVLTRRQIEEGAAKGKVMPGHRGLPPQPVDEEQAVGVALQAFEDGLYVVVLDDRPQEHLDREVYVQPGSRVCFIRLTMLAGGL